MKIVEKNKKIIVKYSKIKEKDLTWRKVKAHCEEKLKELDSSKEHEEIVAIKKTVEILQHKVDLFENKRAIYQRMYNMIHDTDDDIDAPFVKESEGESDVSEAQ